MCPGQLPRALDVQVRLREVGALAAALDVPVISRVQALLGRMPNLPFRANANPETAEMAEEFDQLSNWARQIVKDVIESVKRAEREIGE